LSSGGATSDSFTVASVLKLYCFGTLCLLLGARSYKRFIIAAEKFQTFIGINVFQGVIGLALERYRLLHQAGSRPFEPLVVMAPAKIKPWYKLINSRLIPLSSAIRYAWTEDFCQLLQHL